MKLQSDSFGMCLLKSSAQGVVPDARDSLSLISPSSRMTAPAPGVRKMNNERNPCMDRRESRWDVVQDAMDGGGCWLGDARRTSQS